jgi:hypothetical protein
MSSDVSQQQILQFMTTEHFALASAKAAVVAETNGRAAIYLSTVSSAVVALAFIGQMSKLGGTFYWFGLAIFAPLFFLGVATFVRLYEAATESMIHARRINRIRHFYVELAPHMAPYFEHRTHDDMRDFFDELAIVPPAHRNRLWEMWEQLVSIAGAVAAINSMLAAVFVGFAVHAALAASNFVGIATGAVMFVLSVWLHVRYQQTRYQRTESRLTTMFPSPART